MCSLLYGDNAPSSRLATARRVGDLRVSRDGKNVYTGVRGSSNGPAVPSPRCPPVPGGLRGHRAGWTDFRIGNPVASPTIEVKHPTGRTCPARRPKCCRAFTYDHGTSEQCPQRTEVAIWTSSNWPLVRQSCLCGKLAVRVCCADARLQPVCARSGRKSSSAAIWLPLKIKVRRLAT